MRARDNLQLFRNGNAEDEKDQANNQEQKKEKLRDAGRSRSDAGKSEQRSDERDDQENKSPTQHFDHLLNLIRRSTMSRVPEHVDLTAEPLKFL
jgi:hypothetical protein